MLRDEAEASGRLSAAFVVELLHWLRDQPSSAAPAWHALQRALEGQGDSPEEMLRVEHQREAAGQLAIGNIITTMRLLSSIDWPLFFERVSLVEQILREDPAGRLRAHGFSDARPLPPLGRGTGAGGAGVRAGRRARARSIWRRPPEQASSRPGSHAITSATT